MFLKFPLGIASFLIVVVLILVTGSLLGAPFYYWVAGIDASATLTVGIIRGTWLVDELGEAIILTLIGIPAALISVHVMNGTAFLSGRLARVMLGKLH